MLNKIILASKSEIRNQILIKHGISCKIEPSNVDEEPIKLSLIKEGASPETISKNLAELKANKISLKNKDAVVLGADSVIDLEGKIISKPKDRDEALEILKKLNGKHHFLISSVCLSKNGKMIWHFSDKAKLTMKNFEILELKDYLAKITDKTLYAYNVYQIEAEGKDLFLKIEGNENTIMGLPIEQIKEYLKSL